MEYRLSDDRWTFLPEAAAPLMLAAIRAFGSSAFSMPATDGPLTAETCGSRLLQIVFADWESGESAPDLVWLTGDPADEQREADLESLASDAFDEDPAAADRAADMIAAYHRGRADNGDVQALVDLGDFLYWDRPDVARAAYQEAIDAGHLHALIDLALLLSSRFEDEDAAFAAYRQAISCGEPDLAAEAMYELGSRSWRRDETAAAAMLRQVIDTGHPRWAGQAMIFLGGRLNHDGNQDAAEALWRQAIETGDPETSSHAAFILGELLERKGETDDAKAQWQHVIETRGPGWAGAALTSLVNLLEKQDDAEGLRAAHRLAAAHENPDALYALTQLGQVLEAQGDITGAHQAWQQAIDAGCEEPDYWRERISPPPPRRRLRVPYPPDLPDEFNPRNMIRTALQVLGGGLPPLPPRLTPDMAIPIAYWTARDHAVVLVLTFSRWEGEDDSTAMVSVLTFRRDGDTWTPPPPRFISTGWHHDPLARPGSLRDLGGSPMVSGSGTKTMMHGRVIPGARELSLIQDGREDRRPLDSHFGAWIVCADDTSPFEVEARDADGNAIARLSNWTAHR
jgi:TolA-binding protein